MTAADLATTGDLARLEAKLDRLAALVAELAPPSWMSIADAARALGVSSQTIRAMAERGELTTRRAGRRVLVSVASLRGHGADMQSDAPSAAESSTGAGGAVGARGLSRGDRTP